MLLQTMQCLIGLDYLGWFNLTVEKREVEELELQRMEIECFREISPAFRKGIQNDVGFRFSGVTGTIDWESFQETYGRR